MFEELKDQKLNETVATMFLGWSLAYNSGPSWMTDEARKRGQWVVRKTEAPFNAPNNESVWEGSTPFEALEKGLKAFSAVKDDSMEYDEDTMLDASAVLNHMHNVNLDGGFHVVANHLKSMFEHYNDDGFKERFEEYKLMVSMADNDFKITKENDQFIDFLRDEVVDENYTLAHHIIKNELVCS